MSIPYKPYSSGSGLAKVGRRIRRLAISKTICQTFSWEFSKAIKVGGMLSRYFDQGLRHDLPLEVVPSHVHGPDRVAARISGQPEYLTSLRIPSGLTGDQVWHWADWALLYERDLKANADNAMHHYWLSKTKKIIGITRVNALVTPDGDIERDVAVLLDDMGLGHGFVARWGFACGSRGVLRAKALCDQTFPFPETIESYIYLCASIARNDVTAPYEAREAAVDLLALAACRTSPA